MSARRTPGSCVAYTKRSVRVRLVATYSSSGMTATRPRVRNAQSSTTVGAKAATSRSSHARHSISRSATRMIRARLARASVGRASGAQVEGSPPEPARRAGDEYPVVAERLGRECACARTHQSSHVARQALKAGSLRFDSGSRVMPSWEGSPAVERWRAPASIGWGIENRQTQRRKDLRSEKSRWPRRADEQ